MCTWSTCGRALYWLRRPSTKQQRSQQAIETHKPVVSNP